MRTPTRLLVIATVLLTAAACDGGGNGAGSAPPEGLLVIATTSILGDVVENVAGVGAQVDVLIPLGVDPHGFEPSPRDVSRLRDADLVVANGLGLEEALAGLLDDAAGSGTTVVEVAPRVDPIGFEEHAGEDEHGGEEDEEGHSDLDPHFWTDPVRVADAAEVIGQALTGLDDSVDWQARARRYADRVREAHQEIEEILAAVPAERRKLVTNHEVFGYFAARYDFEVLGAVIPSVSTLAEPSAGDLAALAELLRDEGVPAVFAETTHPTRLAEALRAEVGADVRVVELYTESLGEAGSGTDTYVGMMLEDARRIAEALR